jgi:hypothetical protein
MSRRLFLLPVAALLAACSSNPPLTSGPEPSRSGDVHAQTQGTVVGNTAVALGIPPGHLPPPGRCRLWLPNRPPGHQPAARSCSNIHVRAPAGSMVVYRPSEDKKVVHVQYVDTRRAGVVVAIRVFDAKTGVFLRAEKLD